MLEPKAKGKQAYPEPARMYNVGLAFIMSFFTFILVFKKYCVSVFLILLTEFWGTP